MCVGGGVKLTVIMEEYIFGQKPTLLSISPYKLAHAPVLLHHFLYIENGYLTVVFKTL